MHKSGLMISPLVFCALLAGCQAIEEADARSTEDLLAAAGFEQKIADTAARQAQIQAMPQNILVRHDDGGSLRWTYADAAGCNCIYAGGQAAYDTFQRLREERQVAQMNRDAAMDAEMDWDMWGPWGPWYGPW